jgi:hypothetical protein
MSLCHNPEENNKSSDLISPSFFCFSYYRIEVITFILFIYSPHCVYTAPFLSKISFFTPPSFKQIFAYFLYFVRSACSLSPTSPIFWKYSLLLSFSDFCVLSFILFRLTYLLGLLTPPIVFYYFLPVLPPPFSSHRTFAPPLLLILLILLLICLN